MIALTVAEIAEAVGGSVHGDPGVSVTAPAVVDSRTAAAGSLFVAVVGERVDGHDYADAAAGRGAVAVLGSRPTSLPTVVVDDVLAALGALAAHVVGRLPDVQVLALTGSQGKTGTKDYLAEVLSTSGTTVATAGNFNNEIGVPLTMLGADKDTRHLVLEMGARGIGHLDYLCSLARPTIAAVLNVGSAHVGEFGSREAIAQAKGEIVASLPPEGTAVLNADDPLTAAMAARTRARVVTFGRAGDLRWHREEYDDLDRATVTFIHEGREAITSLRQVGAHQVRNAAAAGAMAIAAGLDFAVVVEALGRAETRSRHRMEITELSEGRVLIDDSYNANPESMRAALDAAATIAERRGARTVAVLSEMRELGDEAEAGHRQVGEYAASRGVDVLLAIGPAARGMLVTSPRPEGVQVEDRGAALAWLRENMTPGDVIVVKASRAAELDKVAAALVEEFR